MLTLIFHCDRDREQAVTKDGSDLPPGWTRVKQDGPEGGYTWVFCQRCSAFFRELLAAFGVGPV